MSSTTPRTRPVGSWSDRVGPTYRRSSWQRNAPAKREVLLKDRLRLNDGLTGAQAERVIFDLERAEGIGMPRNQLVPDLRHGYGRGRP